MYRVTRIAKAFRLSARSVQLLESLAESLDLSNTAVVETAIRRMAEQEASTLEARVTALEAWRRETEQERGG